MMRDYAVIAKEVDLYLPSLFYRLPRLSFGFEEWILLSQRGPRPPIITRGHRKMENLVGLS